MLDELGVDHPVNLIDMALMQSNKDRLFVREVLVHGADAYPRNLGNPVRRDGTVAPVFARRWPRRVQPGNAIRRDPAKYGSRLVAKCRAMG